MSNIDTNKIYANSDFDVTLRGRVNLTEMDTVVIQYKKPLDSTIYTISGNIINDTKIRTVITHTVNDEDSAGEWQFRIYATEGARWYRGIIAKYNIESNW